MKNLFKFTETTTWFDGQGEHVFSFQVYDDGSVEYYDFADERVPAEIKNKWLLPQKCLRDITIIISKIYECSDFKAEETIVDDDLAMSIRANLVEQKFLIYDDDDNYETRFMFKQNNISSQLFCRKAPFTIITNQIMNMMKKNITYFQLQVE